MTTTAPRENTATSPSSKRFYRPELDVVRLVAFLSVFTYHLAFFVQPPNRWSFHFSALVYTGSFGMCLFFVLSSFLITTLLIEERARTKTIHIRSFYVRRILRIWPLYFAFTGLCIVIGAFYPAWHVSQGAALAFVLLAGNWYQIYHQLFGPLMPLWSISLEEQFYLIWPSLAKYGGVRWTTFASLGLVPLSFASIVYLSRHGWPYYAIWWNSFPQFQYFGIGALLALRWRTNSPAMSVLCRSSLFVSGLTLWILGGYANQFNMLGVHKSMTLSLSYLAAGLGCISVFSAFLGAPPRWPPPVVYLGKISYGLYVFHELALQVAFRLTAFIPMVGNVEHVVLGAVLALALTIAAAFASYRYFEAPFLRWKERFTFVTSRSV